MFPFGSILADVVARCLESSQPAANLYLHDDTLNLTALPGFPGCLTRVQCEEKYFNYITLFIYHIYLECCFCSCIVCVCVCCDGNKPNTETLMFYLHSS